MKIFTYITLKNFIGFSHMINNGNRTEWSPIRSVILRVINKIGRPQSGSPICQSHFSMILGAKRLLGGSRTWWERDRTGWPVVFIALVNIKTSQYFSKTKRSVRLKKNTNTKCIPIKKFFPYVLRSRLQFWCRKIRDVL